jgi:hypothetical protein
MNSVLDQFIYREKYRTPAAVAAVAADEGQSCGACARLEPDPPAWMWWVRHPDGWTSHTFTPPATAEEVARWYPGCEIRREEDPTSALSRGTTPGETSVDHGGP